MNEKVKQYIEKQKSPQKEICKKLHKIITKTLPQDEMKWGVPAFNKGDSYIVSLQDHVNIGFKTKNLPKEE
ncbi:MAG: DUF1801 domain-containing protein, partial [Desulfobacterales bacterium]|nr:DUF1801 domain-containing protein [Desulfobacterales bacterium]